MDSIIQLGQNNTLAEYMILSGAENHPPMLDKDLYDFWKSRMELYMQNREPERMILESVEHNPHIWPSIEENGVIRTKKYVELSAGEKIQADCDMKATNIILHGLPADIYSLMNHHRVAKDLWERVQLLMQDSSFAVPVFSLGDDPIACLNKAMVFLTAVASSRFPSTNNQLITSSNIRNQATIQDGRVIVQKFRGDKGKAWYKEKAMLAKAQEAGQILDEEQLAFLADPRIPAVVLMANISNYGFDVISEEKANKEQNNESITTELERYEERVKTFKQRLNIDLSSREKMIDSQMDYMIKEKLALKEKLNRLTDDFRKRFTPQQELSAEQAFWLRISNPTIESSSPPVRVEVPSELPNVSLVFKDQFDSIKQTCVLQKEQSDSLINKLNLKSEENEDLKAQIHDKVFVITSLKNDLRKLKGKATIDNSAQIPSATTVAPGMFKLDLEHLSPKLVHNRESHIYYLKHTHETLSTEQSPLKDKSMCSDQEKKIQKIDRLARYLLIQGLPNDIYSLIDSNKIAKDLWDALARHMLGSEYGYVNDAMGLKKKIVVVTSDPLALIAEKTKVSKRKKKVVVSLDSEGSDADDFSELKKITALLAKAFNQRKFYSKPTNKNLRTSSTSQSTNKKQEFVKTDDKKEGHFAKDCKKVKVKDYEYYKIKMLLAKKDKDEQVLLAEDQAWMESSKTSSSSADDKISEVSYYLSESESESEYETLDYYDNTTTYGLFVNDNDDQENFHDCEKFPKNLIESQIDHNESAVDHNNSERIDKLIRKFNKKIVKCLKRIEKANQQNKDFKNQNKGLQDKYVVLKNQATTFEMKNKELNEQLKVLIEKNDDLLAQTNVLKDQLQDLEIEKYLERLNVCENKLHKTGQTNQTVDMIMPSKDTLYNGRKGIGFENPSYFKKAKDLRPSLYDEKVIGLGYTSMFLTHSDKALEIEKFKRARENKIEFSYDYENLNACYVNEKINFSDDYFQEIINPNFDKIDSLFQQTSLLKPYVLTMILEKIIIDLEDEVVSLLQKEKENLKTIESLKSNDVETCVQSSEKVVSKTENQSENDCQEVEKECDKMESSKVIALGMFKLSVSQIVSPILMSKMSCASKNVENKIKRKRHLETFSSVRRPKQNSVIWKKKGSSNIFNVDLSYHMTGNRALLTNFVEKFLGTVRFGNNEFTVIAGYGDVVIGSMTIKKVYNVEGLGHNLFSVGQFCLPKMKFESDHLCSACEQGKIHQKQHKSKTDFALNKPLYLLHMDLCGPMRVESINGKRYMLVVVDDYSWYTWRVRTDNDTEFKNKTLTKFFDEIMKSSTMNVESSNVEIPSHEEEVFHESSESFQEDSSSSSLDENIQQSSEEVGVPSSNTQSVSNNMVPNVDQASTSHNVFNECLKDAYFNASTSFHDPFNVHTFYQPYPHEKKWTKDHPLHKIIGDPKSSVRTRGRLANSCLLSCLLSSIEPDNVAEALRDDFTVFQMDVKTLFLNEILKEEVYVGHPSGFFSKQYLDYVYALDKALYGLKQAPRAWYDVLSQFLIDSGFQKVPTPMVEQVKLKLDLVGKPVDHTDYQRVKCSTSASGSKPSGNTKNNRISQPSSSNKINKVEYQPRSVKNRKNKKNHVKKVKCNDHLMQSMSNANSVSVSIHNALVKNSVNDVKSVCLCAICGKCMIVETHYECVHVVVSKLNLGKVVQIVLWYLDSGCSKHMIGNHSQLMNFVSKFLGTVRFMNDHIARIMGYGDYQLGNVIISRALIYFQNPETHICTQFLLMTCLNHLRSVFYPKRQRLRAGYGTDDYLISTLTLREFYENAGISHQTSVARTLYQNGVVERQNRTLVEAARTMLIFSKALLFLWAEAINTTCYTQNRSLICLRYNKTPYELMQNKKPDLLFLHVFGSLCYPTNDHEDLAIASGQLSSRPGLHFMTPATSSTGLISKHVSQQPCIPPNRDDWDRLFQPMFDKYFNPPTIAVFPVQEAAAPRAEVLADSPMTNKFKMSIMRQMSLFLGLQISQSPRGIFINQSKYASEIVKKYGLNSTDSVDTPMVENKKLDEDLQGKQVDATLYCGMTGSLMYLTASRPDLNYVVCLCARLYKKQEKMYYPRFTKAIIYHFLIKEKTLFWRNKIGMHTSKDDYLINSLRFVSAKESSKIYGAILPECLTSPTMKESKAYKTYLGYATGDVPPKIVRKFKKASPSKKDSDLVHVDEEPVTKGKRVKRSVKKSSTNPASSIVIRKPLMETKSIRKKKVDVTRGKGIKLLSEVALTEEAQMKEVRNNSLRDFHKTHPSGSGTVSKKQPRVKEITPTVTSEGTDDKQGVPDVIKDDSTEIKSDESDSESDQHEYEEEVKDDDDDEKEEDDDDDKSEGDKDRGMDDTTKQFNDVAQDKKADVEMTDAQQKKENLKITQEQVVEDAHVMITIVAKETKVPDASTDYTTILTKLRTTFENAFNSEFKERMQKYTRFDAQSFNDAMIYNMDSIGKYMLEITVRQQRTPQLLKQKKLMQTQDPSNLIQAFNINYKSNLTKTNFKKMDPWQPFRSSRTDVEAQDNNNRSGNDTDANDAYIRPIYDEEPMAEVQLTAECNIFAIRQQHTEQPKIINEGRVDQYTEPCQVKSPMLDSSPDNQTTDYSKQSLDNKAKIKKEIDVFKIMNIELEHSVAKLRKKNETLKKHYKDLYDSIKITRSKTIEQTTSLLANNADLKAHIQIAALKNDLRKLKGNSVDTKFSKTSVLGKPVLQSLRNQYVVRQQNAFKYERPEMSKQRFASQVDVNNNLSRPVTQHYLPKKRESVFAKHNHMIATSSSRNSSKNMPRFSLNDMVLNYYLEEARKKIQERNRNSKSSELNSRAKIQSYKTRNNNKPVDQKRHTQKHGRQIFTRHRFSSNKTSVVYEKTSHRSDLRWKPMGRIFKSVGLRWIPTGKLFDSCTSKVDSEPPHDMIVMKSMIELESLFGPLFDKYFNEENLVVSKSFAVTTADASDKRQQQPDSTSSTTILPTTITDDGKFDMITKQVRNQLPQLLPEEVSNFAAPVIEKMIEGSLNQVNLAKDSSQPQSTYEVAATLTEFELKKILIDKMNTKCYKAFSKKLDWENPEGDDYPFDLSKPLPLITHGNRQSVLVEFFINNDLKYLQGGISTMTYTTSTTKTKAAQYDLPRIEEMVPNIWSPVKVTYYKYALWGISYWRAQHKTFYGYARGMQSRGDVYSTKRIRAVTHMSVMRKHGYGYLEEIVVRRVDNVLYRFKEGDFSRLQINDIEDMLLLVINVTKPDTTRPDLRNRHPYTPYKDHQGFIYVNDYKRSRHYQEYRHGVLAEEKIEHIGKEKSSFYDQVHQQAAKGKKDDEEFGEIYPWSKSENKGRVPTEMELVLEQTQQGSSYEVSVSTEGVEEFKRKVKIKGKKKEALLTLKAETGSIHLLSKTLSCCLVLKTVVMDPVTQCYPLKSYKGNRYTLVIVDDYSRKVEESLNMTFDETPPPSKTSPLVDDDLDEEEAVKVTEKKNLENDIEDETLEIDEIVNIKESRNHPLENVI
uniref:Uncharacterized mitochondrial protein AtMg00810-like n=1 Tax=Tanacetum cinerariifolium TaxID=118510 RepID=A0A6L2L8U1_TANCI|nr:uncharacterized mitochondrial protein AtMg00810-like [Tanacetum cinerariifolium]